MATNIAITGEIYGKTSTGKVLEGGSTVASNPAESGKVVRVSSLLVSNTTGASNADVIVAVRKGGVDTASSIYFNGAGYLSLGNNVGLSAGASTSFTVEAWIYLNSNSGFAPVFDCRTSETHSSYAFGVLNESYQRLVWYDDGGKRLSDAPVFFNRWTHVAFVKVAGSGYFYIDGVRDTNYPTLSGDLIPTAASPRIGASPSSHYFNGYMEEVRVSNTARYSGTSFSVPTSPFADNHVNSKLLLHGDGDNNSDTFTSSVTSPHTITRTGGVKISTARSVFAGDEKRIASGISVPANATLCVVERPLYLEEGDRLVCLASTNERLEFSCSYEEIA
jgi:hypothetical protein